MRHPLAAVLGVAGIVVGSIAAIGGPATAAAGDLTADGEPRAARRQRRRRRQPFDWDADDHAVGGASGRRRPTVTVIGAQVSDMPGIAPVQMMDYPATDELVLDLAGGGD